PPPPPGGRLSSASVRATASLFRRSVLYQLVQFDVRTASTGWGCAVHVTQVEPAILLAILPLVIIDLAMVTYSIVDLYKPDRRVKGNNKVVWLLVILLVSTFGWLAYLLFGREE